MPNESPSRAAGASCALIALALVAARPDRWDFVQVRAWYARLLDRTAGMWTMADVAESRNRLTFGVADAAARGVVRDQVLRLGIPADAVDVVHLPRRRLMRQRAVAGRWR